MEEQFFEFESNTYNDPYCVFMLLFNEVSAALNRAENGGDLMRFIQFFYCDDFEIGDSVIPYDRHRFMVEIVRNAASGDLDCGTKLLISAKFSTLRNLVDAKFDEVFSRPFYLQIYYMARQYIKN